VPGVRCSSDERSDGEAAVNEFEDRLSVVARMQAELLESVHRSVLDVVTARKRLEERIEESEESEHRIAEQHRQAVAAGEERADLLADQSARTRQRIQELHDDLDALRGAEELLTARAAVMQDQISDFRNAMALVSAKVVAARTSAVAGEALDTLRDALTYVEFVVVEARHGQTEFRKATSEAASKPAAPPASGRSPA
jgi:phage shock protein A